MSFTPNYNVGGIIDLLRNLPYPLFPRKQKPFHKGFDVKMPARAGVYSFEYVPELDVEFTGIAVACSGYREGDYWELSVGEEKLFETIYTKELPESHSVGAGFGMIYPVEKGTRIKFDFYNDSRTSKTVWINLKFLR